MFVEIISSGGEAIEISLDAKSPLLSLNLHPSAHADILIKAPIGTWGGTRSFQKRGPRFFLYLMFDNSLQIKTFLSILFFSPSLQGGTNPRSHPLYLCQIGSAPLLHSYWSPDTCGEWQVGGATVHPPSSGTTARRQRRRKADDKNARPSKAVR